MPERVESASAEPSLPLEPGARVSLEFPEAGTCVALVYARQPSRIAVDLLDPLPERGAEAGSSLELFMPREEGIYYWPSTLAALTGPTRAEVELLGAPVFVQRRTSHRLSAALEAQVRRVHATRRGPRHQARVLDLSRGGMKVEGPFQLSTGDTVEVEVHLDRLVQIACRAVMTYPTGDGRWAAHLSFLEGQKGLAGTVQAYINRRSQAPEGARSL